MFSRMTTAAALMAFLAAAPASAQFRGNGRWGGSSTIASQTAYERGYREGTKEGQKDARDRRFELEREKKYQKADAGYNKQFGDKELYRRAFRQGFATGYTDAFNGRVAGTGTYGDYPGTRPRAVPRGYPGTTYPGRYPTPTYPDRYPGYPQTTPGGYGSSRYELARQNGYYDGIEKGREDWRKNRSADPLRHAWYRSADRGYDNDRELSKDAYRDAYRDGFRVGYEQGYRQASW